jgi:coatomer protein complex subunit gamma
LSLQSCHAVELTEAETEYKVTCTKHVFKENVVFQFKCTNTIQEQVLEDVSVVGLYRAIPPDP